MKKIKKDGTYILTVSGSPVGGLPYVGFNREFKSSKILSKLVEQFKKTVDEYIKKEGNHV